jgi:hypothetical protein
MTTAVRVTLAAAILVAIVVLAMVGERIAPAVQTPVAAASSKQKCDVDARPEELHAAAKLWCKDGLFFRVTVTTNEKAVVGAAQFTPNGAQTWELQSSLLIDDFRRLTNQMAAAAGGRDVGISLNDAGDRRVGACARAKEDAAAVCSTK